MGQMLSVIGPSSNSQIAPPMNASAVMHTPHAHGVPSVLKHTLGLSIAPPSNGNMLEPIQPRCECSPAPPSIAQTEPLHEANGHDQLSIMWVFKCMAEDMGTYILLSMYHLGHQSDQSSRSKEAACCVVRPALHRELQC
jgi:hypothetical protein